MSQRKEPNGPMKPRSQPKPGLDSAMDPQPRYKAPLHKGPRSSRARPRSSPAATPGSAGRSRSCTREGVDVAIVYLPAEQSDAEETKERLEDITDERFDTTFKTNIYGYFYPAKAAVAYLPRGGAIVNCGSITGLEGNKTLIDHAATKGAIHAFTKSLAQNQIDRGIRVNCVASGPIWTPLQPVSKPADKAAEYGAGTPLARPAQPEEVAPAFVFFASEADSSDINGEILTPLGGETRAG